MTHLLDINVLLAANWVQHPEHSRALTWLSGKEIVLCPLSELGFLRISTQPKFGATMEQARTALKKLAEERSADRIADDLPALGSHPVGSKQVTDTYLCDLAAKRGLKLATFDRGITHPSVEQIT
jgi:uncharacterized protein